MSINARNARGQFTRKATYVEPVTDVHSTSDDELNARYKAFAAYFDDAQQQYPWLGVITNITVSAFGVAGAYLTGVCSLSE